MNVLIVDDHPTNRKLLRVTLEAEQMKVLEANDGEEALNVLRSDPVDAVISDILMPNMDGYRLCHELRKDQDLQHLPLIFYTSTYTSPGDRELAISVGADCYLTKPISAEQLVESLQKALTDSKAQRDRHSAKGSHTQIMMKKYSATLVNKLEEKNAELEETIASLEKARDEIAKLNADLEVRVLQRTAELEQRTIELEDANRRLVKQNEEIQSFYHTLSHELKTPLTSAGEFVSLVAEGLAGPVNETQIEYLGLAKESCEQMRVCLNDLLDSTRLDTGKFTLELKNCSLADLVERAVATQSSVADLKQIKLSLAAKASLPDLLLDPTRIIQVVVNLVGNALKFTPKGGKVAVEIDSVSSPEKSARVVVRDSGPGISSDHLGRIFERLYQIKEGQSSSGGGLGLGLYLCRQLVELHGGTISVTSNGNGSAFEFQLPFESKVRQCADDNESTEGSD
ncbi:response regulator [bacterium]|nr:response regulator [bacterium]